MTFRLQNGFFTPLISEKMTENDREMQQSVPEGDLTVNQVEMDSLEQLNRGEKTIPKEKFKCK